MTSRSGIIGGSSGVAFGLALESIHYCTASAAPHLPAGGGLFSPPRAESLEPDDLQTLWDRNRRQGADLLPLRKRDDRAAHQAAGRTVAFRAAAPLEQSYHRDRDRPGAPRAVRRVGARIHQLLAAFLDAFRDALQRLAAASFAALLDREIAQRDDADEALAFDDRQPAYLVLAHQLV